MCSLAAAWANGWALPIATPRPREHCEIVLIVAEGKGLRSIDPKLLGEPGHRRALVGAGWCELHEVGARRGHVNITRYERRHKVDQINLVHVGVSEEDLSHSHE